MTTMKLIATLMIAGSLACGQVTPEDESAPAATSEDFLAPNDAARAEAFAPAAYHEGQALLERAALTEGAEREAKLDEARARFDEALTEAEALQAEAKRIAEDNLEEAGLLVEIVQMIRSNGNVTPNHNVPSTTALQEASNALAEARAAFDRGDFVEAGLTASDVIEMLRRPTTT